MTGAARKVPVVFYRTPAGAEVVRDWLRDLSAEDRNIIGQDLMCAVSLAGRHADLPTLERWSLGSEEPS